MITPQIATLSGSQFVQRGKKFAIPDQGTAEGCSRHSEYASE
jgi:hypothetical protein